MTSRAGEATAIARAAACKYERVIAGGGDGTISEVAHGILSAADTHCALGVVPLGTGNDTAQMIGIRNLEDARRALTGERARPVDAIQVDYVAAGKPAHRHALVFTGVGIVSRVLRNTTPFTKRVLGRSWAYRAALLQALCRYQTPRMRITCDGKVSEGPHFFLGVNNGEDAGGGMRLAPGAQIDDGLLNVNLVGAVTRWEALKQLRRLNLGQHTGHPAVHYLNAKEISVESDPVIEVTMDGELIGDTPARFLVRPKALAILVPR